MSLVTETYSDTSHRLEMNQAQLNATAEYASPSLIPHQAEHQPAYEIKFLLSEALAMAVEEKLSVFLNLDPHADRTNGSYTITSLYCDTSNLDVYHRMGTHRFCKFRLRRYGNSTEAFLERKTKHGIQVRKRREAIPLHQLPWLSDKDSQMHWSGNWYRRQLESRILAPVCRVEYQRRAYFGAAQGSAMRMTFDRGLCASLARGLSFESGPSEAIDLGGNVVCEFKFRGPMPSLFKSAIEAFQLTPRAVSKYRSAVRVLGLIA